MATANAAGQCWWWSWRCGEPWPHRIGSHRGEGATPSKDPREVALPCSGGIGSIKMALCSHVWQMGECPQRVCAFFPFGPFHSLHLLALGRILILILVLIFPCYFPRCVMPSCDLLRTELFHEPGVWIKKSISGTTTSRTPMYHVCMHARR